MRACCAGRGLSLGEGPTRARPRALGDLNALRTALQRPPPPPPPPRHPFGAPPPPSQHPGHGVRGTRSVAASELWLCASCASHRGSGRWQLRLMRVAGRGTLKRSGFSYPRRQRDQNIFNELVESSYTERGSRAAAAEWSLCCASVPAAAGVHFPVGARPRPSRSRGWCRKGVIGRSRRRATCRGVGLQCRAVHYCRPDKLPSMSASWTIRYRSTRQRGRCKHR